MNKVVYIILVALIFLKGNYAIGCFWTESIENNSSAERISEQISLFQSANKEYFKQIILNKFKKSYSKEYLSNLEIVAEPNFSFDATTLHWIKKDTLSSGLHYPTLDSPKFQFIVNNKDSSIYNHFIRPEIDTDNVMISFRIYDQDGNQTDYMEIYEYRDFDFYHSDAKFIKENPLYSRSHLTDTTNPLVIIGKRINGAPKDMQIFSLKLNTLGLYRCVIYNNIIYSIECLQRIYPRDSLENILKYPKEKTCGCDVDNYLRYIGE